MTKFDRVSLTGFRGSRKKVDLNSPSGRSILIYGDNGSGKSSFADGIEWLLYDGVSHLTGEEVGVRGGLKNELCSEEESCSVEVSLLNPTGTADRSLKTEKSRLKAELNCSSTEVGSALGKIGSERISLRNIQLIDFILATKSQKLTQISEIIGFQQVLDLKGLLKQAFSDLNTIYRTKNFEGALAREKEVLVKQLNSLVNTDEQFIQACNEELKKLNLEYEVRKIGDLDSVESKLKEGVNPELTKQVVSLQIGESSKDAVVKKLSESKRSWEAFQANLTNVLADGDRVAKISLSKLLDEANHVLENNSSSECPVCLSGVNPEELKVSIAKRIEELKEISAALKEIENQKRVFAHDLTETLNEFGKFVASVDRVCDEANKNKLIEFGKQLRLASQHLASAPVMKITIKPEWTALEEISILCSKLAENAGLEARKIFQIINSPKVEVATKLALGKNAFLKIGALNREMAALTKQRNTLERMVSDLNERHLRGMETFLDAISKDVNELYLFMHGTERIDEVKLKCLVDESSKEFIGVILSLKYHGKEITGPQRFLSESYLNSLGICLFLASARRFNRTSRFLVLDDVISSYDKGHRIRFAQLLVEKFSDYQLFVLTHESEWFEFIANLTKGLGWTIQKVTWNEAEGIALQIPTLGLKDQIEKHIKTNNESDLANCLRRYSEHLLKDVAFELQVPLPFRFNDRNEGRQFDELYAGLRSRLNSKSPTVTEESSFQRLGACQFLTNKGSHDNLYKPGMGDMKAAYEDTMKFEKLFRCEDCGSLISMTFANIPEKKISCKCGKASLVWKS